MDYDNTVPHRQQDDGYDLAESIYQLCLGYQRATVMLALDRVRERVDRMSRVVFDADDQGDEGK